MYDPYVLPNVDIKPGGLEFITVNIDDLIVPGGVFEITVDKNDPKLVLEDQLYILVDEFNTPKGAANDNKGLHITPFFVTENDLKYNEVTYTCTKVAPAYLRLTGNFEKRLI